MTSFSKHVHIDKWDDIINECNSTCCTTIKMKFTDAKSNRYNDFAIENKSKDPKFKVGYHVIISKYINIFAKGYTPNWSENVFKK